MQKTNINSKKRKIPLLLGALGIGGMLLFAYLTFVPNPAFAEVVDPDNRTMDDIHYMQEMNTKICTTAELEKQYQLIDIRDGKKYWIARLRDNNCWMTQNLDYDIEGTLYPATSDVTEVTSMSTISVPTPQDWIDNSATANYYYDADQDLEDNQRYYYAYDGHSSSGVSCPDTSNGLIDCAVVPNTSNELFTPKILEDDSVENHYLIGNYYSWHAATAGKNELGDSICPKGWRLPANGGGNTDSNSTTFGGLMTAYSIGNSIFVSDFGSLYAQPLYFVYGGYVYGTKMRNAGGSGFYWSSTPQSSNEAYRFDLTPNYVNPANSYYARHVGMSIRCVNDPLATTSESFPYTPPIPPAQGTANISVTVSPVISLDVSTTSTSGSMTAEFTQLSTSKIITNVSSNYQYTVTISTEQPALELSTPVSGQNIPMITTDTDIKAGNVSGVSAWGIKKKLSATDPEDPGNTNDADVYSPVGTTTPETFYKSSGPEALTTDSSNPLEFTVGVGVSPNLPSGTYSTTVTITASVI